MRKITIICDKCKREVEDATLHQISNDESYDLCAGCLDVLNSWIDAKIRDWCQDKPLAEEPVQEEIAAQVIDNWEKKMKAKSGRKIEIDYDKACALRRAGWSYDKIADELNCGPSTIYRKLHQEGYYEAYLNGARMGGNKDDEGND